MFSEFKSIFDCKFVGTWIPNPKTSKQSSTTENEIAFWKIVPYAQLHPKRKFYFTAFDLMCFETFDWVQKPHLKPVRLFAHSFERGKMPRMSFVRKVKAKVSFTPQTQLSLTNQFKRDLKTLFENSWKNVWQGREQKYSPNFGHFWFFLWIFSSSQAKNKILFSIFQLPLNIWCQTLGTLITDFWKKSSESDVPSQKQVEKDVFTPNQLRFR